MPKFANFSRSQLPSCPTAQLLIKLLIFQGVVSYFLDHSNPMLPDGGGNRCAIADTYWQTETGSHLITPLVGAMVCKPGGQCWIQHFGPVKNNFKVDQYSRPSSRPMLRTSPAHSVWKLLDILKMEDECFFFFSVLGRLSQFHHSFFFFAKIVIHRNKCCMRRGVGYVWGHIFLLFFYYVFLFFLWFPN